MGFRFSLMWLLAVTGYAAVVTAAFAQPTRLFADLLWLAGLGAFGYAVLLACFTRGASRARGAGFALFTAIYAVCAYLAPESVPTARLLIALGVGDPFASSATTTVPHPRGSGATSGSPGSYQAGASPLRNAMFSARGDPVWMTKLQAAHAVAFMAVGLVGSFCGALAVLKRSSGISQRNAPADEKNLSRASTGAAKDRSP